MRTFRHSTLPFFISEPYDQVQDGELFADRVRALKAIGYAGIELAIRDPERVDVGRFQRLLQETALSVAALGTGRAFAVDGLSFTHPDPEIRRQAVERVQRQIDFAEAVGRPPVIIGLIRGRVLPGQDMRSAETHVRQALQACADYAGPRQVRLALEPINRYETNLFNTVEQALAFLDTLQAENVGLLLDTFHMNIEEPRIAASIRQAGRRIFHFHLADSNRLAPGWGHLPFEQILRTLALTGYDGYLSGETFHYPEALASARQTAAHLHDVEARLSRPRRAT